MRLNLIALVALGVFATAYAVFGLEGPSAPVSASIEQPPASRVEVRTLSSTALGRDMPYKVFLPPGYDATSSTRYPVLYMLHGLGGSYAEWEGLGLFETATDLMQRGQIEPMIIVTPEGERGYWVDHTGNGPRFGTYIARDLVSAVDLDYRTLRDRSSRAVGGMSMGGQGALQLALNNPDEFSVVGAHSVALRRYEEALPYYGSREYFEARDPVAICAKDEERAERLMISIDIGTSDMWYGAAERFHQQLRAEGIRHTWSAEPGDHDASYWKAHVDDYLHYYSGAFQAQALVALAPS